MVFEIREEKTICHTNGVVEVKETVLARKSKDQIKDKYHDLDIGHRRNIYENEDFSKDRIYSVVRIK